MKILITGSKGFVGRVLTSSISTKYEDVLAIYRGCTVNDIEVDDFLSFDRWESLLNEVDIIIHLVGLAHKINEAIIDQDFIDVNVGITQRLAKTAASAGVKRFIYISSIKVNGGSTLDSTFKFDDSPNYEDIYGESKYRAEEALKSICLASDMEYTIIRPPLVYGQGVKANFASLLKIARTGLPLPFGAVNNKRDMVAVDNLCDLIVTCIDHPNAANQTFLVSDGVPYSLKEIICLVREADGRKSGMINIPQSLIAIGLKLLGKQGAAQRLLGNLEVDIQHTCETLNWRPKVSLKDKIAKM